MLCARQVLPGIESGAPEKNQVNYVLESVDILDMDQLPNIALKPEQRQPLRQISGQLLDSIREIQRIYSSAPRNRSVVEKCANALDKLGKPSMALRMRVDFARAHYAEPFLQGNGIEIGALSIPMPLPAGARVHYVDRMNADDLRKMYPNARNLVPIDIVDDGERLGNFSSATLDFIVANHFLEHCQDPILTISNMMRVLRKGGILFMAVPDKRFTFDRNRPVTSFDHLLEDHKNGARGSRDAHYDEWVRLVAKIEGIENIRSKKSELLERGYSIHFHVWTQTELVEFLVRLKQELGFTFEIQLVAKSEEETIVILQNQ